MVYIHIYIFIHSGVDRLWGLIYIYIAQMWYTIFFQYILTWKSLIQNNEKLRYWIWTNFGPNSWNLPTKYRPHMATPLDADSVRKNFRGSPSETESNHGICSMIPQQEYGSTRIHQKKNAVIHGGYWGWFHSASTSSKLIVIPWKHFQNSSQNPEKSDKNPKTSIFSNKKRKMPSQGDPLRGPPCFGLSQHPDAPSQATPARSCHLLSLWPSHGPYGIIIHVSPDGNAAELSLFLLMINIIQQTSCCWTNIIHYFCWWWIFVFFLVFGW